MFIITVEGDSYPKFTEKVDWKEGRVIFECVTKKGKIQKHNVRADKVIDIVETDRRSTDGELPLDDPLE